MPTNSNDQRSVITRRNALKSGVAGGIAALAGCSGGNGSGNQSADVGGEPVDERVDKRFTKALHRGTYDMDNASWNPFDPANSMNNFDPPGLIFDPLIIYHESHDELQGVIANNWEEEDGSVLVELSDEWTWHNGDPVTAHDLTTRRDIEFAISDITSPDSDANTYIQDYEAVDDYAIRYHLHDDFTMKSVLANALPAMVSVKEDTGNPSFGEWRDDLVDVDPESDEASQIVSDFQEWTPELDEVVGNGPFQIKDVTDSVFVGEIYEDHPNAENIYFTEYAIEHHEDQVLAFMEESVDAIALNLPDSPDVMDRLPPHHEINRDYDHAWSVLFNFGNYDFPNSPTENPSNQPITSDRRVRHAIAYALDKEKLWASVPQVYDLYELPSTFLNQTAVDEGIVDVEGYDDYALDRDQAASLMEDAGYQRDGGQWYDENGDEAQLVLYAQSSTSVQVDALDAVQSQMEEFGFSVSLEAVDEATYGEARLNGDHDIIFDNHPVFSIRGLTWVDFVWSWFSQLNHADYENTNWEIPAEVGNPDASDTMEINVMDQIEQLHLTGDNQYVQNLTWWYNQVLPMYNCVIAGDYGAINAKDWHVDASEALLDNRTAEFYLTKVPDAELIPYEE
ncbi:ABC transporter substrate-binding protein [Halopiger xanaduensis]|uniref:ABC-type transporter, periplasmic subunit n=1 Tax=Halopiger xanaduensis (strain DSM 18323 / JCM 14033 / SH-6) TaxID=797210 RepID=F8DDF0_HALXS|nr:ABC transporter substrate-binding protein [Halopiger xanaduensis]AEH39044.1 ABC-type transporter, periplasmic subunit [Halopiger xanaduensis SH-6]